MSASLRKFQWSEGGVSGADGDPSPRDRGIAVLDSDIAANTTISTSTNATGTLLDYSGASFANDMELHINGVLMRCGASSGSDYDVYAAGTAATGDFACEFNLKQGDVIQQFIGGGSVGSATKFFQWFSLWTTNDVSWYSWATAYGPNVSIWNTATGSNASDPTMSHNTNGVLIPNAGTLTAATFWCRSPISVDVEVELWKIAWTDGMSSTGTKTLLASGTDSVSTNRTKLSLSLDSTALNADDALFWFYTRRSGTGALSVNAHVSFEYTET